MEKNEEVSVVKILMIGPFPPPVHGMSLGNKTLKEALIKKYQIDHINTTTRKKISNVINMNKFGVKKIWLSFIHIVKGTLKILFNNYNLVYITPSQSINSYLKYIPFIFMANKRKQPIMIHIHGGYFQKMIENSKGIKKKIAIKSLKKISGAIVLGNSFKNMFTEYLNSDSVFVCENGADNHLFLTDKEIEKKIKDYDKDETIRISYLSNLIEAKGILDLLEAVLRIKKMGKKIKIYLAGAIEPRIKKRTEEYFLLLDESVEYYGVIEGIAKKEMLKKSYCFCLPSKHPLGEGQPISIIEGMATGNLIVTTNLGAIPDVVSENYAIFIEKNNIGQLCTVLQKKIDPQMLYKGWEASRKKYKSSDNIKKIEKAFTEVIKKNENRL